MKSCFCNFMVLFSSPVLRSGGKKIWRWLCVAHRAAAAAANFAKQRAAVVTQHCAIVLQRCWRRGKLWAIVVAGRSGPQPFPKNININARLHQNVYPSPKQLFPARRAEAASPAPGHSPVYPQFLLCCRVPLPKLGWGQRICNNCRNRID
jgi:hypothetical protein